MTQSKLQNTRDCGSNLDSSYDVSGIKYRQTIEIRDTIFWPGKEFPCTKLTSGRLTLEITHSPYRRQSCRRTPQTRQYFVCETDLRRGNRGRTLANGKNGETSARMLLGRRRIGISQTPKVLTISGGLGKYNESWEMDLVLESLTVEELL
jgi:hypothetical protein